MTDGFLNGQAGINYMCVGTAPALGVYAFARYLYSPTRLFTFYMDWSLNVLMVGFGDFFVQKVCIISLDGH